MKKGSSLQIGTASWIEKIKNGWEFFFSSVLILPYSSSATDLSTFHRKRIIWGLFLFLTVVLSIFYQNSLDSKITDLSPDFPYMCPFYGLDLIESPPLLFNLSWTYPSIIDTQIPDVLMIENMTCLFQQLQNHLKIHSEYKMLSAVDLGVLLPMLAISQWPEAILFPRLLVQTGPLIETYETHFFCPTNITQPFQRHSDLYIQAFSHQGFSYKMVLSGDLALELQHYFAIFEGAWNCIGSHTSIIAHPALN